MRTVEILEETGVRDGRDHFKKGEVVTLEDNRAANFIHQGWAKCVQTGEVGERKPGVRVHLHVHDQIQRVRG